MAGRVTLARSVISSIPDYPMQVALLPKSICLDIEKLQRNFVWGGNGQNKKWHLIDWHTLCLPKNSGGLGFRNLSDMNSACIAKLTWKIVEGKESLWTQVIWHKYITHRSYSDPFVSRPTDSSLWKAMCCQKDVINQKLVWRVKNGATVKFFTDCWIRPGVRIMDWCYGTIQEDICASKVNSWVTESFHWDLTRISRFIPSDYLYLFGSIPVPREEFGDDICSWGSSPTKSFTMKEAYHLISSQENSSSNRVWKAIWKWKGLERIRLFLWKLNHDILPTNKLKNHCFGKNPDCLFCPGIVEDSLHAVRDYPLASKVWKGLLKPGAVMLFFSCSIDDWISLNLSHEYGSTNSLPWQLLWGYTTWLLWQWRNKNIFYPDFRRPRDPLAFIWSNIHRAIFSSSMLKLPGACTVSTWQPPKVGWIKVNTDGSSNSDGSRSGCGGLFRDSNGCCLCGFVRFLGEGSPSDAEAKAILHALQMAWQFGFKQLIVETDALEIVKWLNDDSSTDNNAISILLEIARWQQQDWFVRFNYTPREFNIPADVLASWASSSGLSFAFQNDIPVCIRDHVDKDAPGILIPTSVL